MLTLGSVRDVQRRLWSMGLCMLWSLVVDAAGFDTAVHGVGRMLAGRKHNQKRACGCQGMAT